MSFIRMDVGDKRQRQDSYMRKWLRRFGTSGFFIPFILLLPYVCTIVLNGADKALLLHSPGVEELVPLVLVTQLKGDYEDETVKAQAVIARSEVYRRLGAGESKREILWEESSGESVNEKTKMSSEDGTSLAEKIKKGNAGRNYLFGGRAALGGGISLW